MATIVVPASADLKTSVELQLADMLSVGHSLRILADQQKTPPGTAEIYARVGREMVAAAHAAIRKATA